MNQIKGKTVLLLCSMIAGAVVSSCGRQEVNYDVDGTQTTENSGTSAEDSTSKADTIGTGHAKVSEFPTSCHKEIAVGTTGLQKITVDDDEITLPDTEDMKIAHYKKRTFSNEEKKDVLEKVFDKDDGIYVYDRDHQTKADIQMQLDAYQSMKEAGSADPYLDEEISELEGKLATAPEEYQAMGDCSAGLYTGNIGNLSYTLATPDEEITDYWLQLKQDALTYRPKTGAAECYYSDLESYLDNEDNQADASSYSTNACTLTEEEAKLVAEDFISDVSEGDVALTKTSQLGWFYSDATGMITSVDVDGYIFEYVRAVNGRPVSTVATNNLEDYIVMQRDDEGSQKVSTLSIPVETYRIYVDDNGVIEANWEDEFASTGEMETAGLLSFHDLFECANETVPAYYATYPTHFLSLAFNEVTLTYFLKQDDAGDTFSYVPAWVFATYDDDYSRAENCPTQMVVLNATDGSVIDLTALAKALGTYYGTE